jgi:hypothetical protein
MKNKLSPPNAPATLYLLTDEEISDPILVYGQFFRRYGKRSQLGIFYSVDEFFHVVGAALATQEFAYKFVNEEYMKLVCYKLELLLAGAGLIYCHYTKGTFVNENSTISAAIGRLPPMQLKSPMLIIRDFFKDVELDGVKAALYDIEANSKVHIFSSEKMGKRSKLVLFESHLIQLVEASYILLHELGQVGPPLSEN